MNAQSPGESVALQRLFTALGALLGAAAVVAGLLVAGQHPSTRDLAAGPVGSPPPTCADRSPLPSIVLVHAPPTSLSDLASDAAYLRTFLEAIDSSRGRALVYVAARALPGQVAVLMSTPDEEITR